ncbi:MAG: DUF4331 family protein [Candidatus Binatia bacterium]
MNERWRRRALGVLCACLLGATARAADHVDGPRASADPAADITDVFAWMSPDATRLNLVMDVTRNAGPTSRFSDAVRYTFRTASHAAFAAPAAPAVDIVCTFDAAQTVTCSAGAETVSGDSSDPAGITSPSGALRVFAGLRDDPFFFNLSGFRETARIVTGAASSLSFDAAGCPAVDVPTSSALVTQLARAPGGGPPADDFGGQNVLALVVSVDRGLVTGGGSIVSVSGATERR